MAKHIAPPATANQIMQALGVTHEDRELIDRVLKEVEEEEFPRSFRRDSAIESCPSLPAQDPSPRPPYGEPEGDKPKDKKV